MSINEKTPLQNISEILDFRDRLSAEINPPFTQMMGTIMSMMNNQRDETSGHELPDGSTRELYRSFIEDHPILQCLYRVYPQKDFDTLLRYFGYNANKLKMIQDGILKPKSRKAVNSTEGVVYPIHTHIELPYFGYVFNFLRSKLTLSMMFSHDCEEEGLRLKTDRNGDIASLEPIDLRQLDHRGFDKNIRLGVYLLTEARSVREMVEDHHLTRLIKEGPIKDQMNDFELLFISVDDNAQEFLQQRKILIEDPLIFGGLALQIAAGVEFLMAHLESDELGMNKGEMLDLAKAVVATEMADRMSDAMGLERFVYAKKYSNKEMARFKTMNYVCRLMNMYEKLVYARELIKSADPEFDGFEEGFEAYTGILEIMVERVNVGLETFHVKRLTWQEIQHYYYDKFKPRQELCDRYAKPYVNRRIKEIF
jgi:hypothetical protein